MCLSSVKKVHISDERSGVRSASRQFDKCFLRRERPSDLCRSASRWPKMNFILGIAGVPERIAIEQLRLAHTLGNSATAFCLRVRGLYIPCERRVWRAR